METLTTLNEWLNHHGFKNGANPFEHLAAENFERTSAKDAPNNLEACLEKFDYFEEIDKPATTFLFLPRGAGKSTIRLYLANRCEKTLGKDETEREETTSIEKTSKQNDSETRLPITYTDFHRLIRSEKVTLKDHVDGILRETVPRIFTVALKNKRFKKLSPNARYDLVWLLAHYPERLHAEAVQERIKNVKVFKKEKKKIASSWLKLSGRGLNKYFPGIGLLGDALSTLVDTPFEMENISETERSPLELMECLYEIAKELEIKKIYIFIDRIDEYCEIHDVDKAVRMIRPLVETVPLLEMNGFAFKFFLPLEYRSELLRNLRSDRLNIYDNFEWDESDLKKMLGKRLDSYCYNKLEADERQSFGRLFEEQFDETTLLNQMIQYADKSPRNLIRLAKRIIDEHSKAVPDGSGENDQPTIPRKISKKTYERALGIFASNQIEWLSRSENHIANLAKLDLSNRKSLETLLEEDFDARPDGAAFTTKWRREEQFESPHFSLMDVTFFIKIPKKKAQEIVLQWEDANLITSHYRIMDEGLSIYIHTKRRIEWLSHSNDHIASLAKLKLHERKSLETLLEEDFDARPDGAAFTTKWRREEQFESPHFSLTDVIHFLNIPKKEAQEIVRQWEDANLVTSHYKIVKKGLSTYIHTNRR